MRYSLVLSVLALVSAVGAPAAAQPREEEAPTSRWYGWQILAAVGVCDTVAAVSTHIAFNGIGADRGFDTRLEASGVWLVAAGVRALSAPTVHFAHGNVGRGFGSLLLNLTVPAATGALGALGVLPRRRAGLGGLRGMGGGRADRDHHRRGRACVRPRPAASGQAPREPGAHVGAGAGGGTGLDRARRRRQLLTGTQALGVGAG